jgi:cell division protein FtsI/penicillin-binding protein 2
VIAENLPGYTVKLIANNADSLGSVLRRLATVVTLDSASISDIVRRWRGARYQPAVVFGEASFETASRLEEHRALLPGLVLQSEPRRLYPAGKAVAHGWLRVGGDRRRACFGQVSGRTIGVDRGPCRDRAGV